MGRGDARAQYTKETIELIKKEASKMRTNESIKAVQFGRQEDGGIVWLARNPGDIIDSQKVVVDGVEYYFGLFKKKQDDPSASVGHT